MSNLFPSFILHFSSEKYKHQYGKVNRSLYNVLVLILIVGIMAMAFIKVPVTVESSGLIKAQTEKRPSSAPPMAKLCLLK